MPVFGILVRLLLDDARGPIVEEPLAWAEQYPIQWREPRVDLAELAKLRWIEGLSRKELAQKYGKTAVAIQNYFQGFINRRSWRKAFLLEPIFRYLL
jgi:hypothetical protein